MAKPKPGRKPGPEPPGRSDAGRLTYKQKLFVSYYLGEANGNATEAARMAGYLKPREQGYENLTKPHITAAVDARLAGPAMAADEVLARLSDMAAADMADFLTPRGKGKDYEVDVPRAVRDGRSHLIRKLTPTKYGIAIELYDAQAALEKLGKYHRLFAEKGQAEPDDTGPAEELARKLDRLASAAEAGGDPGGVDAG